MALGHHPVIVPRYYISASSIPGAGRGLYVAEPVARGRVIIAPDNVHTVYPESRFRKFPPDSLEVASSVRWFEDRYSLTPEWSDECFVNHSFVPTALWHLGFVFSLEDLAENSEITVDYRLLIGDSEKMPFSDAVTGQGITGLAWSESLARSVSALAKLFPVGC